MTLERDAPQLEDAYCMVRSMTELLAAPLSAEDQTAQSMPEVSPTKWHRAHTTWFFETFVLERFVADHEWSDPAYRHLFNSYYETVGSMYPRPDRGVITRPGAAEVGEYRRAVDAQVRSALQGPLGGDADVATLVELGLHHEQQHQELLLMDIKHVLSRNPTAPVYRPLVTVGDATGSALGWVEVPGGVVEVGADGTRFCFDNELPRHRSYLEPFLIADRLVTVGEWIAFIDDGGYDRPELWLSDGWATVRAEGWQAPLYWLRDGDEWLVHTLGGTDRARPHEPVCHVSHYEADAYARWAGARLPTEFEWERVADVHGTPGRRFSIDGLHPRPVASGPQPGPVTQMVGECWQWTASAYLPYPGFQPAPGAVGEYNGKFMSNQMVLRGGCALTPAGHTRPTYRNFFPPAARWPMTGVRLAGDRP